MNRRIFLSLGLLWPAVFQTGRKASSADFFSDREARFVSALATTMLPQGTASGSGASGSKTARLLAAFLSEDRAAEEQFRHGLARLESMLSPRFPKLSPATRTARLKPVLAETSKTDAVAALEMIKRCAVIELFTRREGRDLLGVTFRTAVENTKGTHRESPV